MSINTIAVVGSHNSGKTTVILKLVEELKKRNHNVAVIKYHHHEFDLDPESKDSYLLRKSDANITLSITPNEIFSFQKITEIPEINDVIKNFSNEVDTCIVESYPKGKKKIPTIFVANELEDLEDTLERYSNIQPIFITGRIVENYCKNPIKKFKDIPFININKFTEKEIKLLVGK